MSLSLTDGGSYRHADDPGEPSTGKPRLSVTDEEGLILSLAAAGRRVLEIGTGLGVSTRMLAESAESVVTVDIDPWVRDTIWPTLPENVSGVAGIEAVAGLFDVAFIDGDHSTDATRRDIDTAKRLVRPGGLIAVHDVKYPKVKAALTEDGWRVVDTTHGLGFLWV